LELEGLNFEKIVNLQKLFKHFGEATLLTFCAK